MQPGHERSHLRLLEFEHALRGEIDGVQTVEHQGIIRHEQRLQSRDDGLRIGGAVLQLRQRRRRAADGGGQRQAGAGQTAHGRALRLGAHAILLVEQSRRPHRAIRSRGVNGDDESLGRAGGQLDHHGARLVLAELTGGDFQLRVERLAVVEDLKRGREPRALRHDAVVADEQVEPDGGLHRQRGHGRHYRQPQARQQPAPPHTTQGAVIG